MFVIAEQARVEAALGLVERACARLDAALARFPLADMAPLDRPYADVAAAWATVGEPDRDSCSRRCRTSGGASPVSSRAPAERRPLDAGGAARIFSDPRAAARVSRRLRPS